MGQYEDGFAEGFARAMMLYNLTPEDRPLPSEVLTHKKTKRRKLSAWQKFVKVNSKKPRFKFKSGAKKGRINLKALGVAYRKTPAGKKR